MRIYFAPLEGITGHLFRQVYERNIGGIDRYFAPFVTTRDGGIMKRKEKRDILPENNAGIDLVPQIMTNSATDFCQAARHMEELGYREVNLNLGCPSGTVVPKGKGAGMLRGPEALERFLDEIYAHCPIAISIKSRIGFYDTEEFARLLEIYNQYPVRELILHLRTREELYKSPVHEEIFGYAQIHSTNPLCYNGDICTPSDVKRIQKTYPSLPSVMIGRGFLMRPGFVRSRGGNMDFEEAGGQVLYHFLMELEQAYEDVLSGETPVLHKMKELWTFLKMSYPDGERVFKRIKKVKHLTEYKAIMEEISGM